MDEHTKAETYGQDLEVGPSGRGSWGSDPGGLGPAGLLSPIGAAAV